jgi:hypothetical protein
MDSLAEDILHIEGYAWIDLYGTWLILFTFVWMDTVIGGSSDKILPYKVLGSEDMLVVHPGSQLPVGAVSFFHFAGSSPLQASASTDPVASDKCTQLS